jgi:hypothetical protein
MRGAASIGLLCVLRGTHAPEFEVAAGRSVWFQSHPKCSTPSTEALRCVQHGPAPEICTRKCGRENFSARTRGEYEYYAVLCSGCSQQPSSGARKRELLVILFTARHVPLWQIRPRRESRRLCPGHFCRNDTCCRICVEAWLVAAICTRVWCEGGIRVVRTDAQCRSNGTLSGRRTQMDGAPAS